MTNSILFLTSGKNAPASRFRVHQMIPGLEKDGFLCTLAPCRPYQYSSRIWSPFKLASRLLSLMRAPFHDLVYIERELLPYFPAVLERLAGRLNRRIHFDFDDAVHLKYAEPDRSPVATAIRLARGVTAGNRHLADWAGRFNPSVTVVPTVVDTDRFTPTQEGDHSFVWTGTSSNLPALRSIVPALQRLRDIRLLVICDRPPGDLGLPVTFLRWKPEIEVEALRRGKIGLMPLFDDEWSRGKCGFKLLQYMACGLPVVASPVGVNADIVGTGEEACGFTAEETDAWADALQRLLQDPSLRKRLGDTGRRRVLADYSVKNVYPLFRDALSHSLKGS